MASRIGLEEPPCTCRALQFEFVREFEQLGQAAISVAQRMQRLKSKSVHCGTATIEGRALKLETDAEY